MRMTALLLALVAAALLSVPSSAVAGRDRHSVTRNVFVFQSQPFFVTRPFFAQRFIVVERPFAVNPFFTTRPMFFTTRPFIVERPVFVPRGRSFFFASPGVVVVR